MPPFLRFESPAAILDNKKGPKWDPSFKSYWRRAGDVRACCACPPASKPDGFSPTGYKRFCVCLTPVPSRVRIPTFSKLKKGPKWDPSFKSYWRRAGDSNPRCPFGAYSLSRRAPSASRSALRNSRSIVTKQPRMSKRKFSNCLAAFLPWKLRLPQRAVEGAELVVAHGAPHLEDATARQEKETVIDQSHSGICQLIRHGGHWRQL